MKLCFDIVISRTPETSSRRSSDAATTSTSDTESASKSTQNSCPGKNNQDVKKRFSYIMFP